MGNDWGNTFARLKNLTTLCYTKRRGSEERLILQLTPATILSLALIKDWVHSYISVLVFNHSDRVLSAPMLSMAVAMFIKVTSK